MALPVCLINLLTVICTYCSQGCIIVEVVVMLTVCAALQKSDLLLSSLRRCSSLMPIRLTLLIIAMENKLCE